MKSICYMVLPPGLSLDEDSVYHFVKEQIYKYHIEYEAEPYKMFFQKRKPQRLQGEKVMIP